ncbi:hypothetical protein HIV01_012340 [Lysobacter arenosi]|uniref:Uncharacterized protein n=1 Tax=Lysobacter arenosi TaxID=2795387 RepID=A0ABX7RAI9_9GAMM|nr:hypothetical protein [Lysobacter arenosi]QSX74006.1 hypothetical protein HIV01_012340 [Lysobacter arenosi]
MASTKREPSPGKVRVKILPKDPLVARRDSLWPIQIDIDCPTPGTGPTGPHSVVVDYNADLDVLFAPAVLQKNGSYKGIAALSGEKLLENFQFHQVNVWAIVERTLAMIEDEFLLGRTVPWATQSGRLLLIPHAGYDQNAFYDRASGALHFFYFEGMDGKPVYTCLSHDIIAHELGHAVLDGLKPGYNEVTSRETAGFHEYFGDAVAMMASLGTRETARVVTRGGPEKLDPMNVVSAIASEFGAALRGLPDAAYLRGAWNNRKIDKNLLKTFEEHDWSEVLTGVYYDLLEYLYPRIRKALEQENGAVTDTGRAEYYSMKALIRAATITAGVMFRGIDYCPPVDLRYDEYARAVLRAQEVAYPYDVMGIRKKLRELFDARGIALPTEEADVRAQVQYALRGRNIAEEASTPADAYRFLDRHRDLFRIPYAANLSVTSVYRTNKQTKSGYRPPKEHVIEFTWSEDVKLSGARFHGLNGTFLPLWCGGTLVFDANGNYLHAALVPSTPQRIRELKDYAAYLVQSGNLAIADAMAGIGAPSIGGAAVSATVDRGRVCLKRNAAMRHHHSGEQHDREH